jgi:hypothetical protein
VQQLVLHLKQKHARNKQANNQAKEAHPKKTVHKIFPQLRKNLRIRNAKIASGNAKICWRGVRKARKTSFWGSAKAIVDVGSCKELWWWC